MCGVSGIEFLIILVAAVVFLGPDRLPEAMRTLGKLMREVRKVTGELSNVRDDFTRSMREETKTINDTVQRRESAGRAGQDVSDIDAIRAKRAAAAAATSAAVEFNDEAASELPEASGESVGDHADQAAADAAAYEAAKRNLEKGPVQLRPAARSMANIANPYRPEPSDGGALADDGALNVGAAADSDSDDGESV